MTTDLTFFLLSPNGEQTGTFSLYQVKMMQKTGFIGPETRFWTEGMTEWLPITRIEEYIDYRPPISIGHTAPPKPHTWSGSLARAIPSPNQKTGTTVNPGTTPMPRKIEIPMLEKEKRTAAPEPPPAEPEELPEVTPEPIAVAAPAPEPVSEPDLATLEEEEQLEQPKPGHLAVYLLVVLAVFVLALSGATAWWLGHKVPDSFVSVTFAEPNVFALLDQGGIRSFQGDLVNSPMLNDLNLRIAQTDDPETLKKLKASVEEETAKHRDELEKQYVQDGKAQLIPAGKYRVVGYFSDEGEVAAPSENSGWVAISYKDTAVFARAEPSASP